MCAMCNLLQGRRGPRYPRSKRNTDDRPALKFRRVETRAKTRAKTRPARAEGRAGGNADRGGAERAPDRPTAHGTGEDRSPRGSHARQARAERPRGRPPKRGERDAAHAEHARAGGWARGPTEHAGEGPRAHRQPTAGRGRGRRGGRRGGARRSRGGAGAAQGTPRPTRDETRRRTDGGGRTSRRERKPTAARCDPSEDQSEDTSEDQSEDYTREASVASRALRGERSEPSDGVIFLRLSDCVYHYTVQGVGGNSALQIYHRNTLRWLRPFIRIG